VGVAFCVLVTISIFSCNFFVENGGLGISLNIKDSKKRKVFINEYKVDNNPYKINDNLSINIKSVWLEHQWLYTGENNERAEIIENNYQLIIITDKQSLKGYNYTWFIGSKYTNKNAFFEGYNNSIIISLDTLPNRNIIEWKVQSLNKHNRISDSKIILGKLSIEKLYQ
jgi:hypothetical protein